MARNPETTTARKPAEGMIRHLPNLLTMLRVAFCPLLFYLILEARTFGDFLLIYYLFVFAGLTDIYDGKLARSHQTITTFGKFVDPVADKLLLAATLIPFHLLSDQVEICRWVTLPVLLILLGREVVITLLRYYSIWTGKVFSASRLAKFKTAFQMFFIGSVLVHLIHRRMMFEYPEMAYGWFDPVHDKLNLVVIVIVLGLSIFSGIEYIVKNVPLLLRQSRA